MFGASRLVGPHTTVFVPEKQFYAAAADPV